MYNRLSKKKKTKQNNCLLLSLQILRNLEGIFHIKLFGFPCLTKKRLNTYSIFLGETRPSLSDASYEFKILGDV